MSGIYISVYATPETQQRLTALLAVAAEELDVLVPQELHVTLAHDASTLLLPQELTIEADPLRVYKPTVLCVEQWRTGSGNPILVASLSCPELSQRWDFWKAWGLSWSFPSYRPHFSLTDGLKNVPEAVVRKWCRIFNEALQGFEFTFSNEYVQTVNSDSSYEDDEAPDSNGYDEHAAVKQSANYRKVPMPRIPVRRPRLTPEEERSMRLLGFNAHGIRHRVHDNHEHKPGEDNEKEE